jgi:hypothetical protein
MHPKGLHVPQVVLGVEKPVEGQIGEAESNSGATRVNVAAVARVVLRISSGKDQGQKGKRMGQVSGFMKMKTGSGLIDGKSRGFYNLI